MARSFEIAGLPEFVALGRSTATERDHLSAGELRIPGPRAGAKRWADFVAGRAAAREALRELGMRGSEVLQGASGEPLWPAGVVGSIAHSSGVALAMAARTNDVLAIGLDLEHMRSVEGIAGLIAFAEELEWFNSDPEVSDDRLLELFTAKEAVFKALFPTVRRYFGFEAVRLHPRESGFVATVIAPDLLEAGVPTKLDVHIQWAEKAVVAWVIVPAS